MMGAFHDPQTSWHHSDGTPASVHSYDCVAYLPTVDRIWSAGGIYWSPAGKSDGATFWWNPGDAEWTRKANRPGGYGCASAWDARGERLLVRLANEFVAYTPKSDGYTRLFTQPAGSAYTSSSLALDPASRRIYRILPAAKSGGLRMIDLEDLGAKEQTVATEGDTGIERLSGVGLRVHGGRLFGMGKTEDGKHGAIHVLDPADCGRSLRPSADGRATCPPATPTPRRRWRRGCGSASSSGTGASTT